MELHNKNICFVSCNELSKVILERLIEDGLKINNIISLTKEQSIKYKVSGYGSFEDISKKYDIPIFYPKEYSMKSEEDINFIKKNKISLLLVLGWNRLIPKEILDNLNIGAIGVHGSSKKLPKGRGRSPINWSIIRNKKKFIAHLFFLDEGVDSGKIIDFFEFDINKFDTCKTIFYKVLIVTYQLLIKNIDNILRGKIKAIEQKGNPSYYPKRTPEDGLIHWNKSTKKIYNLIRGITKPYPGAFTYYKGEKVYIWKAQPFDTKIKYETSTVGEIVEIFGSDFVAKTKTGTLLITDFEGVNIDELKIGEHLHGV